MFCQKCGNKLDDNAKFCTRCGTPTSISLNEVKNSENKSNRNTSSPLDTDTEDYIYIPPKRPVSIEKILRFMLMINRKPLTLLKYQVQTVSSLTITMTLQSNLLK